MSQARWLLPRIVTAGTTGDMIKFRTPLMRGNQLENCCIRRGVRMNARPTNHANTTKAYAYRRQRRPAALAGTKRQGMQNKIPRVQQSLSRTADANMKRNERYK